MIDPLTPGEHPTHRVELDEAKPTPAKTKPKKTNGRARPDENVVYLEPKPDLKPSDFVAYMPMHNYIFKPTRETWPGSSVNARIPPVALFKKDGTPILNDKGKQKTLPASDWLDKNAAVEQATWAPGKPMLIPGKIISDGGWIDAPDCTLFNLYRPPTIVPQSADVSLWLDHIHKLNPDHAESQIIPWLGQRVQRPWEKINHALVLLGKQGIGKDTLLEPVKRSIGPWNFSEVNPMQVLGRFNSFLKSVILRISEARDVGDYDRYALYDHLKAVIAAPPDVLRVDEKHLREHSVPNVTGVIITANDKQNGIYLPSDDRRHLVMWSPLSKDDFTEDYWNKLYNWYGNGGNEAVAYYLANLDISAFNPKAPPPKTQAFWEIVDASRSPEDAEFADALDVLSNPNAVTLVQIKSKTNSAEFAEWLGDRKNSRKIPHRMEACGYEPMRNKDATDGMWKICGKRQVIYVKRELNQHDRHKAVEELRG
jgi:Family of unknown function (DUF5906)